MPVRHQLEIISRSGEITFHTLDLGKGIANIGQHPDNDIIIDGPGVAPFHAILLHRQRPFRVVLLNKETGATLEGQHLQANVPVEFHPRNTMEIGGHKIILLEGEEAFLSPGAAVSPVSATPSPTPPTTASSPPVIYVDRSDDVIVTEISSRELVVDVEQTVTCQLTIINGGDIVAAFEVGVTGVDQSWVTIAPPMVNLNEGERTTVTVAITPPRQPTSRAGTHPVALVVTSPDHPGRVSQVGAMLIVNPYYQFAVGQLSPRRQTVSWRKRMGEASITVANKGNSQATFRLEGEDEERKCSFEFLLQDEGKEAALARQAEVSVPSGETATIPVRITPLRRPLVGLRGQPYSLTLTTAMVEGDQIPRSLLGQLTGKPLLGPLHIALSILLLIALLWTFVVRPHIYRFEVIPPVIQVGEETTLSWTTNPFATDISIEGIDKPVSGPSGEVSVVPEGPATTYRLRVSNWVAQLFPQDLSASQEQTVLVVPLPPTIDTFSVDTQNIVEGDPVTVNWAASDTEELILRVGDVVETIPPEEHVGQREFTPDSNTLFALEARNSSAAVLKSFMVWVSPAASTQAPIIEFFAATPNEVVRGRSSEIQLAWSVVGETTNVEISSLDAFNESSLAARDIVTVQVDKATVFVLTAVNGDLSTSQSVAVGVYEPIPASGSPTSLNPE